jgi:Glycosyltransferase
MTLKKVVLCFDMPHGNSYVGGIAVILNKYLEHKELFSEHGIKISLFDESQYNIADKSLPSKVRNIIDLFRQNRGLRRLIKKNPEISIHIHTSIGWTLFKDLMLVFKQRKRIHGQVFLSIHFAEQKKILASNRLLRRFELSVINKYIDKVIFLSERTRKEFVQSGLKSSNSEVLYTFHDFPSPAVKQTDSRSDDTVRLLFVGSIDRRKGILDLLEVIDEIGSDNFNLAICGKISDERVRRQYEAKVKKLGSKVTEYGYISGEKKYEMFSQSDVLVLPSYGEGMPIVIMEGMAAGNAIVSTTVGAIPEIVKRENGILVQPGNRHELKSALESLIHDRNRLEEIKKYNSEHGYIYSMKLNIEKLCDIYGDKSWESIQ